jgi:putative membrane protein
MSAHKNKCAARAAYKTCQWRWVMKLIKLLAGSAALLGLAACSTTAQAPAASNLSAQDLSTLTAGYQLIQFDLAECSILAASPTTPQVAALSQKICVDATSYQPQLQQLAATHNVTLPNTLPEDLKARYVAFHYFPTPNVTVHYLRDQIDSHEDALSVFQVEAMNGTDPDVKAVATRTIPVIESNLAALRQALGAQE